MLTARDEVTDRFIDWRWAPLIPNLPFDPRAGLAIRPYSGGAEEIPGGGVISLGI
jgi:hypothetical protein